MTGRRTQEQQQHRVPSSRSMAESSAGGGVLVAALVDTLAPLLTVLSVSTTLLVSMLLLRYARPATAAQLQQSSSAFLRQLSYPRIASRTALLSTTNSGYFDKAGGGQYGAVVKSIPSVLNEVLTPTGVVMPHVVHRVLEPQEVNPRLIVVGDVHGCLDELRALLEKAKYDKRNDTVVLVGDLVNKGPLSAEVVRYVREQGFYAVRGNHDDSALAAYYKVGKFREGALPDSYSYVNKFNEEDVRWLSELPYSISIPHMKALVVHAGVVPGVPLESQTAAHMSRIRSVLHKDGEHGGFEGVDYIKPEKAEPWAKCYDGPLHVFFGHDAKRMLQLYPHATGLDTGACYGKMLTAAILPSGTRVSVPSLKVYTKPGGD